MKTAILFDSLTGNTQKIAEAIQTECLYENYEIEAFGSSEKPIESEMVFLGSWVVKGSCSDKMKALITSFHHKKIALFMTAGEGDDPDYKKMLLERVSSELDESNQVLGIFVCYGQLTEDFKNRNEKALKENPEDERAKKALVRWTKAQNHPDEEDFQQAKAYAREMLQKSNH